MRSLKRFMVLLLCAALVFSLAACGSSDTEETTKKSTKKSTTAATEAVTTKDAAKDTTTAAAEVTTPAEAETTAEQQTKPGIQVETAEPTETESQPISEQGINEAELAFNTYNGYAWMTKDGVDSCYNEAGELQFTLPKGTRAASVFYDGYAAVMQEGERGIAYVSGIIDTKGNVILDAEMLGVDGFIFGIYENQMIPVTYDLYNRELKDYDFHDFYDLMPVEDRFLENGGIFVYKFSESYEGVSFEVGIVNVNGSWVFPLAKDNIATQMGCYSPGALLQNLTYCGAGVWMKAYTSYGYLDPDNTLVNYYFYYLGENLWGHLVGHNIHSYKDSFGLTFENGRAIAVGGGTTEMSYIYLPESKTFEPVNKDLKKDYFYNYDREEHVIFGYGAAEKGRWNVIGFDDDLNELFRTNYHYAYPFAESSQGYLPITIRNEKETEYWALIDRNGQFLFEPKEGVMGRSVEKFIRDDKFLFFRRYDQLSGYYADVYDLEGNEVCTFEPYKYTSILYHNGAVRVAEKGGGVKYINP